MLLDIETILYHQQLVLAAHESCAIFYVLLSYYGYRNRRGDLAVYKYRSFTRHFEKACNFPLGHLPSRRRMFF